MIPATLLDDDTIMGIALTAVATLATVVMIGLGFIYHPRRATLLWSFAMILVMVTSYGVLGAQIAGSTAVGNACVGLSFAASALIWNGFRADRRAAPLTWVSIIAAVAMAVALALADPAMTETILRGCLLVTAAFGILVVIEIRRLPGPRDTMLLPIVVLSVGLFALAALAVVDGLVDAIGTRLLPISTLVPLGQIVYLFAATISLLAVATRDGEPNADTRPWTRFVEVAEDRLVRAEAAEDSQWAVLDVALDDVDDIRAVVGGSAFTALSKEFEHMVRTIFPADADIGVREPGNLVVLLSRPSSGVREYVRLFLERMSRAEAERGATVPLSASVGWAPVAEAGYRLPDLLEGARTVRREARTSGGDRWRRIGE